MRCALVSLFAVAAGLLAACGNKDPLASLNPDERAFLFAGSDTNAAFLGQPIDVGPLACNPQRMNQGYVLIDQEDGLWLDSLRPSGVERHKLVSVTATANGFDVEGLNGAALPFSLTIEKIDADQASISWDGAPAHVYKRCPGMPA